MSEDVYIGRAMLKDVRESIRKNKNKYPKDFTKRAWSYKHSDGSWEVQLPKVNYQWWGAAGSSYEAKAIAFETYMCIVDNGVM